MVVIYKNALNLIYKEYRYVCTVATKLPYTAKHLRGKAFAAFANFYPYRERFPVCVLHASGAYIHYSD